MEPRHEERRREEPRAPRLRPEEKLKRFRLIRLEDRIAPKHHTFGSKNGICESTGGTASIE